MQSSLVVCNSELTSCRVGRFFFVVCACANVVVLTSAAGIWSMVSSTAAATQPPSPLADRAVLLLLVLTHQQMSGQNPYRRALLQFTDEHSSRKTRAPFSLNLQKLYIPLSLQVSQNGYLYVTYFSFLIMTSLYIYSPPPPPPSSFFLSNLSCWRTGVM